jgi:hypothetical protein
MYKIVFLIVISACICNATGLKDRVQYLQQCSVHRNAAPLGSFHWSAESDIAVYFRTGDFTVTEKEALATAVSNWNLILAEIGVDSRLKLHGESRIVEGSTGSLTVTRGFTYRKAKRLAEIYPYLEVGSEEFIRSALVVIDPEVTSQAQLSSVFAHELAHSFGLDDCPKCPRGSTIMALYRGVNGGNGLDQPSLCDKVIVAERYSPLVARLHSKQLSTPTPGPEATLMSILDSIQSSTSPSIQASIQPNVRPSVGLDNTSADIPNVYETQSPLPNASRSFSFNLHVSLFSWDRARRGPWEPVSWWAHRPENPSLPVATGFDRDDLFSTGNF